MKRFACFAILFIIVVSVLSCNQDDNSDKWLNHAFYHHDEHRALTQDFEKWVDVNNHTRVLKVELPSGVMVKFTSKTVAGDFHGWTTTQKDEKDSAIKYVANIFSN